MRFPDTQPSVRVFESSAATARSRTIQVPDAAMPHWQGDSESGLVRVINSIGLTIPYYLLMHRDMQHTPRVRAFADFVASEIKSFRALLSGGNLTDT